MRKLLIAAACLVPLAALSQSSTPAPDALKSGGFMSDTVSVPFGEAVEDCVEDKFALFFIVNTSRYGAPEDRRDTVIQYDPARGTLHLAMFGGSKTTDSAKKRLESRKEGLDYAVKLCAKELGKPTKTIYSQVEMTYTQIDRERGEKIPLVRWFRGRWELL